MACGTYCRDELLKLMDEAEIPRDCDIGGWSQPRVNTFHHREKLLADDNEKEDGAA